MAEKARMFYDRTVGEELRRAFEHGGVFRYLVEVARRRSLLDLQFRGYPHTSAGWATLYLGLTKVFDIKYRGNGRFSLHAHRAAPSSNLPWKEPLTAKEWRSLRGALTKYVDQATADANPRFTSAEGIDQAMLSTAAYRHFSVIDREAVIGFRDRDTRRKTHQRLQGPLLKALRLKSPPPWWRMTHTLGGELDILAVNGRGQLLVLEVKPGSALQGIAWAPLQVLFYAQLFAEWARYVGNDAAHGVLSRMLDQRVALCLTHDSHLTLKRPLEIIPVVAIGGEIHKCAVGRLTTVKDALARAIPDAANLEVWRTRPSVEIQPVELS